MVEVLRCVFKIHFFQYSYLFDLGSIGSCVKMSCLLEMCSRELCSGPPKKLIRIIEEQNLTYNVDAVQRKTSST